jgi:hypothetical protein
MYELRQHKRVQLGMFHQSQAHVIFRTMKQKIKESRIMAKEFFIERRGEEGDYAIRRRGSERASDVCDKQSEAIERAQEIEPNATILVERVRNTNAGSRDKWRKP